MYHKEKWVSMNSQDHEVSVHNELFSNSENIAENMSNENVTPDVEQKTEKDKTAEIKAEESVISKKKTSEKGKTRKKTVKKDDKPKEVIVTAQEPQVNAEISVKSEDSKSLINKSLPDKNESNEDPVAASPEEIHQEIVNYSLLSKEDLIKILEEILHSKPIQDIRRDVETIKVNFYKKHRAEIELKRKKFIEQGGLADEFEAPVNSIEEKASVLLQKYRDLRMEYNRNQDDSKVDNLRMRLEVIEEIKELINSEESINKTFQEFRDLQTR
jgi:hypothetical protein